MDKMCGEAWLESDSPFCDNPKCEDGCMLDSEAENMDLFREAEWTT